MSRKSPILPGHLLWSGEHWVCCLRELGSQEDSVRVSLYRSIYSPAGQGHVAIAIAPGFFKAIYTDNRPLLKFIQDTMFRGRTNPFDSNLPIFEACFCRRGELNQSPSWIIKAEGNHLSLTWKRIEPPTLVYRGELELQKERPAFTILFFCQDAEVFLNEHPIGGVPYPRNIWREAIGGGDRSSCVFAIAETMIRP